MNKKWSLPTDNNLLWKSAKVYLNIATRSCFKAFINIQHLVLAILWMFQRILFFQFAAFSHGWPVFEYMLVFTYLTQIGVWYFLMSIKILVIFEQIPQIPPSCLSNTYSNTQSNCWPPIRSSVENLYLKLSRSDWMNKIIYH